MKQKPLFHESISEAIGADIAAIGGFKKVAGLLWPALASDTGAAKLRACLNADQPHKLSPDEVMLIKQLGHEVDSDETVRFEDQWLSKRSEWISPEDEHVRLLREFNANVDRLDAIKKALQRNDVKLSAVR